MSEERSTRTELCKRLRKHRVETVTAEYDGSGDSGQLEIPHLNQPRFLTACRRTCRTFSMRFSRTCMAGGRSTRALSGSSCGT